MADDDDFVTWEFYTHELAALLSLPNWVLTITGFAGACVCVAIHFAITKERCGNSVLWGSLIPLSLAIHRDYILLFILFHMMEERKQQRDIQLDRIMKDEFTADASEAQVLQALSDRRGCSFQTQTRVEFEYKIEDGRVIQKTMWHPANQQEFEIDVDNLAVSYHPSHPNSGIPANWKEKQGDYLCVGPAAQFYAVYIVFIPVMTVIIFMEILGRSLLLLYFEALSLPTDTEPPPSRPDAIFFGIIVPFLPLVLMTIPIFRQYFYENEYWFFLFKSLSVIARGGPVHSTRGAAYFGLALLPLLLWSIRQLHFFFSKNGALEALQSGNGRCRQVFFETRQDEPPASSKMKPPVSDNKMSA